MDREREGDQGSLGHKSIGIKKTSEEPGRIVEDCGESIQNYKVQMKEK